MQELQNEINCMNASRDFQDAESIRSGHSHVASQPVSFPPHPVPGGMLSPFYRNAEPQRWARQAFGIHMVYRETFLEIQPRLLQHLIHRNWIHGVQAYQNQLTHHRQGENENQTNTSSGSEMPVQIVSQKINYPSWGRFFKELWGRPTTTADFRSSFRQIHQTSNVCLLEDKIQDWGMYLFTISYGSYAVDQRSGDGWFSGWFKSSSSNARFWSTRCEDCFSTEHKSSIILTSKEGSVWRNKKPKNRTVSFAEDRSLTWSTSTSRSLEPMIPSRIMPTYLLLLFEMMIFRNSIRTVTEFIINDANPIWWHLVTIV